MSSSYDPDPVCHQYKSTTEKYRAAAASIVGHTAVFLVSYLYVGGGEEASLTSQLTVKPVLIDLLLQQNHFALLERQVSAITTQQGLIQLPTNYGIARRWPLVLRCASMNTQTSIVVLRCGGGHCQFTANDHYSKVKPQRAVCRTCSHQ